MEEITMKMTLSADRQQDIMKTIKLFLKKDDNLGLEEYVGYLLRQGIGIRELARLLGVAAMSYVREHQLHHKHLQFCFYVFPLVGGCLYQLLQIV